MSRKKGKKPVPNIDYLKTISVATESTSPALSRFYINYLKASARKSQTNLFVPFFLLSFITFPCNNFIILAVLTQNITFVEDVQPH